MIGGFAQFLVFEAVRVIPASVMATVEYSALPWAFLLGYLIWRDIPAATKSYLLNIEKINLDAGKKSPSHYFKVKKSDSEIVQQN